jgi:hypothetical protein
MTSSRQRTLVFGLILLSIVFVGFFGLRFFRAFREFRGHRPPPIPPGDSQSVETDVELIRDWMTIGFISHTYHTPPNLLYKALEISPRGNEEKSLQQLNDQYFPNQPGYVLTTVKETIRANQPIPTALPPDTAVPAATAKPPAAP